MSKDTISRITERVLEELGEWQNRPLERVYPVIFIDALVVKVRDGSVANRPVYTALAVNSDGERDILGLWIGDGGEGAKFWHQVLHGPQILGELLPVGSARASGSPLPATSS